MFVPDQNTKTLFQCESCKNFFQDMESFKKHPCSNTDSGELKSQDSTPRQSMTESLTAEKGINWNVSQTLLLFDLYKEYVGLVNNGKMKKKSMWEAICNKFKEMGYGFSSEQICGRWKSLLRAYKNTKDNNKKSGNSRKRFEYESQMDEILANDPSIEPECTMSSCSASVLKRPVSTEFEKDDDSSSGSTPEPPAKKAARSNAGELISLFKTYLDDQKQRDEQELQRREQMHTERMEAMHGLIQAISGNRTRRDDNCKSRSHLCGSKEGNLRKKLCFCPEFSYTSHVYVLRLLLNIV